MVNNNELQAEELEMFDQFLMAFIRFKHKIYAEQQKELNHKLNPTKIRIIYMLSRERLMAVDIVKRLQLTSGATTVILNQLEAEGYIIRARSEEDRRIVWLYLTEEGQHVADKLRENRERMNKEILGLLSKEERVPFLDIVKRIEERILAALT
ncbi:MULTISPECIES: MarR family winged helix-turn-helix transcriptional regulator [Paenibacillus]|uniref:MarR family transcriptional regulator n=1 Tax=Paenibacillus polygoni TaxID=3050112 RepID=A0ABY8XBT9_9BACL|nr:MULTISPECIES: MarR family transcriptional regulator [Paenibacillus]WIV20680.1 MarR family transcriptional regulator [Paenibacillus polygoni]